jgi:hypothetical protein
LVFFSLSIASLARCLCIWDCEILLFIIKLSNNWFRKTSFSLWSSLYSLLRCWFYRH